jgi:DASS family divalent anion:Na+ symporter
MKGFWGKLLCILLVPVVVLMTSPPAGLTVQAWQLFAVYLAAILGIMLRPLPEPVILLTIIALSSLCLKNIGVMLSGFASTTAWLVFAAFLLSRAFVDTGLGKRIAYVLIGKFGKTSLGLGYVATITDLIISPATPSNTARSGGIVYPIFRSISTALGSEPGPTGRKFGSFLTLMLYQVSLSTGLIFLTAMAPNALVADFAQKILGIDLSWWTWALAASVPGMIALLLTPLVVYKLYPPELKVIPNAKELAAQGLREMGPMTVREKVLAVLFVLAILAWSTSNVTKFDATAIAIAFVSSCLLFRIVSWESVLAEKGAWSTLIWYGGIIGLSGGLAKANFFSWMAKAIEQHVSLSGFSDITILGALLIISLIVRYLFASTAAYVASFIPVLYTIGLVAKAPVMPLALLLAFSAGFGSLLTHYGGALGPVLFGTGYVEQKTWWMVGTVIVIMNCIIYLAIGLPFWKVIGLW